MIVCNRPKEHMTPGVRIVELAESDEDSISGWCLRCHRNPFNPDAARARAARELYDDETSGRALLYDCHQEGSRR